MLVFDPSPISALGVKSPHLQLLRVNQLLCSNPTSSNTTSLNTRICRFTGLVALLMCMLVLVSQHGKYSRKTKTARSDSHGAECLNVKEALRRFRLEASPHGESSHEQFGRSAAPPPRRPAAPLSILLGSFGSAGLFSQAQHFRPSPVIIVFLDHSYDPSRDAPGHWQGSGVQMPGRSAMFTGPADCNHCKCNRLLSEFGVR